MTRTSPQGEAAEPDFTVALETICFIIIKAREFDAKVAPTDPNDSSNPSDDREISVLEDTKDDPVEEELRSLISSLSVDEQIDLVALMWLGRAEEYSAHDWQTVRAKATEAYNERTAEYLCGTPLLADYLSDAIAAFGLNCADTEAGRL